MSDHKALTYGPNTTNGGLPAGRFRIAPTASIWGGLGPMRRLKGVNAVNFARGGTFGLSGKKSRGSATLALSAACIRRRGKRLRQNRTSISSFFNASNLL